MTVYNFSAGPAVLPKPVMDQIQRELPSLQGSGMSILEISHRSDRFQNILDTAKQDLKDLLQIPDNYEVLFCQGGGTGQFAAVPLNLANHHRKIALLDSGHWASGAADEAADLGYTVDIVGNTKANKYQSLPYPDRELSSSEYDYLYTTLNNTIEGTTYHNQILPDHKDITLVGDMSSNFMAERYNVSDFGLIFAGAQKNLAPAGVTIVIVRKDLIHPAEHTPKILNYAPYVKKDSMFNTPPVFPIYVAGLVAKWLKDLGGIDEMERINQKKAAVLYDYLDESKLFHNHVKPSERSLTNITFSTGNEDLDAQFVDFATQNQLVSVKGHRSVGGLRASLYNAMPIEGAKALVDCLHKFEQTH
ncbi:3-phosphoserine/phosphohydroxythreonine transaminase [Lactobacillus sp. Sy-1]|uniref:3-phosphoserine/phosphohydroxythreonine transaminase n=1 Tax=Lactobacillus sp. Sy-1 TaxID=2109645 RepID=UPI001C589B6B|nr:3-phosphoserine/phosphohydroxythreonine transaminase [Lactobacillus sp. Sy-1]MBW1604965.1 3-phosphoserine/phosphohydroxythreonine transaminase [Lactobacillus sp. Sy-1]